MTAMHTNAASDTAVVLRAESDSVVPGEIITFTVKLCNCYNYKSIALVFDYDTDNDFEIVSGKWLLPNIPISSFDITTAKAGIAAAAFDKPTNTNNDVFELKLKVKESARPGQKQLRVTSVIRNGTQSIPCADGTVSINVIQLQDTQATLNVSNVNTSVNSEIEVTVGFHNCDKCKSVALVFDYDTDKTFEIISGEWLLSNASISGFDIVTAKAGIAAIAFNSEKDINGDVFLLKLRVKEDAPSGDAFIKVTPIVKNGSSDIACAGDTVKISIAGQCEMIKGDITSDGKVTAKDRMFISRYLAGWNGYLTIDNERADVDNDGYVTANDRMMIARYVAGWEEYKLYFE